jgi:hypothetical protein
MQIAKAINLGLGIISPGFFANSTILPGCTLPEQVEYMWCCVESVEGQHAMETWRHGFGTEILPSMIFISNLPIYSLQDLFAPHTNLTISTDHRQQAWSP